MSTQLKLVEGILRNYVELRPVFRLIHLKRENPTLFLTAFACFILSRSEHGSVLISSGSSLKAVIL